jgi:hypothetical protein
LTGLIGFVVVSVYQQSEQLTGRKCKQKRFQHQKERKAKVPAASSFRFLHHQRGHLDHSLGQVRKAAQKYRVFFIANVSHRFKITVMLIIKMIPDRETGT